MRIHPAVVQVTSGPATRAVMLLAGMLSMSVLSQAANAADPVRIGIQAFRSNPQTLKQWQPLVAALKQAVPERDFVVLPLTNEEMESAAASRQLDFVFTNPSNYVVIAKRSGLSSPLAALAEEENGQAVTVFGGIIFCRSGQTGINALADLVGKTIAATTIDALGSYQMQAYELSRAGIRLPRDAGLLFTGLPQDNVVEAVLSGRADAGFVRTGLLESMAREGKLDMAKLKIINRQNPPGYPLPVSTRLYPNWPFAAMPGTDESLARRVAVALFRLEEDTAATRAMKIRGFVVPADYKPVEEMLEALRLPPFGAAPEFTLHDVWTQYRWQISGALLALGLILLLGYRLSVLNYRLRAEQRTVLQQQEQLRRSEYGLSEAQRIAQVGNWNLDLESNTLTWSDEIFRIFEIDPEQFGASYEAFLNAIHPDDRDLVNQAYTDSVKNKVPYDIVHRLRMPDGRVKYVNERCETHYGTDGRPLRSVGTVHDITARKRAEENLTQLNERYSLAIRAAHLGVWDWDIQNNELVWDEGMYALYGVKQEDFASAHETWLKGVHPDDRATSDEMSEQARRGEREYDTEFRVVWPNGGIRYLRTSGHVVRDAAGKPLRMTGISRDITERKRVEDALVFVAQRGWQTGTENFFDALAQFLGERLDMDYVIIDRIIEGQDMAETVALYAKGAIAPNMRYPLKGTPCENVMGRQLCIYPQGVQQLFPEDTLLPAMGAESYLGIPLWDSTGRALGLIAVMSNKPLADDAPVTQLLQLVATRAAAELERKHTEEEIRKLNESLEQRVAARTTQLEASNKELEAFAYSVSHDLRAPLRHIDGYVDLLVARYRDGLDEKGLHYLDTIACSARQMGVLIDDLLEFSRTGRTELNSERVDMDQVLLEVLIPIKTGCAARGIEWVVGKLPPVRGDSALLRQVWANLLENAVKFTRLRKDARIEVGGSEENGETIFVVKDNGIGFDMRYVGKLFGVFQRLHSQEEFEGTGIGLATVERIVARHGGRVWAEGTVGGGAAFHFSLPQATQGYEQKIDGIFRKDQR